MFKDECGDTSDSYGQVQPAQRIPRPGHALKLDMRLERRLVGKKQ